MLKFSLALPLINMGQIMEKLQFTTLIRTSKDLLQTLLTWLASTAPVLWFDHHKERIVSLLLLLWVVGCGFWVFKLITIDVLPRSNWLHLTDNPRDALVYLCFGTFGLVLIIVFASYIMKFIYNMLHGGFQSLLSNNMFSVLKPSIYIIALVFAFSYIEDIKAAGLTAYHQVNQLVDTSNQREAIKEDRSRSILDLIDVRSE